MPGYEQGGPGPRRSARMARESGRGRRRRGSGPHAYPTIVGLPLLGTLITLAARLRHRPARQQGSRPQRAAANRPERFTHWPTEREHLPERRGGNGHYANRRRVHRRWQPSYVGRGDVGRSDVGRIGAAGRLASAPGRSRGLVGRLDEVYGRLGEASGRIARSPGRDTWRAPAVVRATAMVGLLCGLAIWVSMPGNLVPEGQLRLTQATPTSRITAAGSVTQPLPPRTGATGPSSDPGPSGSSVPGPEPDNVLSAAAPCHIRYSIVSDGPSHFTVLIAIANTSGVRADGWTLRWDLPSQQKIVYAWNASLSNGSAGAVATDIDTSRVIEPGASVTIGFVGKRDASVPMPTWFALNGEACQWQPVAELATPATTPSAR